eukprot:CCRYP_014936-RG/>CCRYP_014936-RG protein AED:0.49 eAED:1.00 QI:0/0/0/1/0/0/2/0/67
MINANFVFEHKGSRATSTFKFGNPITTTNVECEKRLSENNDSFAELDGNLNHITCDHLRWVACINDN